MKKDIDVSPVTNTRGKTETNPRTSGIRKGHILLAIGGNAITDTTKTAWEKNREQSSLPLQKLFALSNYTSLRKKSTAYIGEFFRPDDRKQRIGRTSLKSNPESRNCEFEQITTAELLATNILSFIGKSTCEY